MLSSRLFRCFSRYSSPQKYSEFIKPSIKPEAEKVTLDHHNKKALTFRKVELEDFDFQTEESDFDTERFSLKEYLYTSMFYTERTMTIFVGFMTIWTIFAFISKFLIWGTSTWRLKIGTIGYFGITQPAFRDMELERKKQRVRLGILHSYD
jgi:hypothetical protein